MSPAFSSNFPAHCPLCPGNTKSAYIPVQAECPLRQLPFSKLQGHLNPFPTLDNQLAAAKNDRIGSQTCIHP